MKHLFHCAQLEHSWCFTKELALAALEDECMIGHGDEFVLEMWETADPLSHLPTAYQLSAHLIEHLSEHGELTEGPFGRYEAAVRSRTAEIAVEQCLEMIAAQWTGRMAETLRATEVWVALKPQADIIQWQWKGTQ